MNPFRFLANRVRRRRGPRRPSRSDNIEAVIEEHESAVVLPSLEDNLRQIKEIFGDNPELVIRRFWVGSPLNREAAAVFLDSMVDAQSVDEHVLRAARSHPGEVQAERGRPAEVLAEQLLTTSTAREESDFAALADDICRGDTVIFVEGLDTAIAADTRGIPVRAVEEPSSEAVVRGPREGFVESLEQNAALIRKHLHTPALHFKRLRVGRVTATEVRVAYIKGIVNDHLIEEIVDRIERIDTDGILESGMLEEYLEDSPWSPFPQVLRTERPDRVAANLLEGRAAIFVEQAPFVLVAPSTLFTHLQSAEDYYERWYIGSFLRALRFFSFVLSFLLPAAYIAVTTYHQELLPTDLVLSLASARTGVPYPALVEVLVMEVIFEVLREAGIRLPRFIGGALTIVGALVIGDTAARAGLVSPGMLIIVAVTAIASFSTPGFSLAITARLIRFAFIFSAAVAGLYGIQIALFVLVTHLVSLRSFGIPYLAPVAPLVVSDMKDFLFRLPTWAGVSRPRLVGYKEPVRQDFGQMPRPPQGRKRRRKGPRKR